jgi:uncharacterized protein YpmB
MWMRKKVLGIIMVMVLCLGVAVPVFANSFFTKGETRRNESSSATKMDNKSYAYIAPTGGIDATNYANFSIKGGNYDKWVTFWITRKNTAPFYIYYYSNLNNTMKGQSYYLIVDRYNSARPAGTWTP